MITYVTDEKLASHSCRGGNANFPTCFYFTPPGYLFQNTRVCANNGL